MEKPTNSESGSPTGNPDLDLITQKRWRTVCAITLAGAVLMAGYGVNAPAVLESRVNFAIYWGVFFVLLAASLYIVILDIRYIRLQYAIRKRELLLQTLGDEEFRKALLAAQERRAKCPPREQGAQQSTERE